MMCEKKDSFSLLNLRGQLKPLTLILRDFAMMLLQPDWTTYQHNFVIKQKCQTRSVSA